MTFFVMMCLHWYLPLLFLILVPGVASKSGRFVAQIRSDGMVEKISAQTEVSASASAVANGKQISLSQLQSELFTIAGDIYLDNMSDDISDCWSRDVFLSVQGAQHPKHKDHIGIYTCKCEHCRNACAMAFEGSDNPVHDYGDWVNNLNAWETEFCGMADVHRGFAHELTNMMEAPEWNSTFKPKLQQCEKLYSVGHSLGGACATLFAACVNCPNCTKPDTLQGIMAEAYLYSVAAPPVAYHELTNGMAVDGIFKGLRAWNFKEGDADAVPTAPSIVGLKHPKIETIGLNNDRSKTIEVEATDPNEGQIPFKFFSYPWQWAISEHAVESTVKRAWKLLRNHTQESITSIAHQS